MINDSLKNSNNLRALIVDDDTVNGVVLENYFSHFNTDVELHAERALRRMKEEFYDLVLMDIHLSDENYSGIVLMKEARKLNPLYKNALFVAVTGYAMAQDEETILNAGFDAYFVKPVEKDTIVPAVNSLLEERKKLK